MVSTSIEDLFTHLLYHLSVNLKRRNSFDLGFGIETVGLMRVSTILIEEEIISKERAKPKDIFKDLLSLRLV